MHNIHQIMHKNAHISVLYADFQIIICTILDKFYVYEYYIVYHNLMFEYLCILFVAFGRVETYDKSFYRRQRRHNRTPYS